MDIIKELNKNQTLLVVVSGKKYNDLVAKNAKLLGKKSVIYVTLNKTCESLTEQFKKKKVNTNNLMFVDAISKTIMTSVKKQDNCYLVSSPGSLTELSLTLSEFLDHGFDYLVFDSLTNMAVYEKKAPVVKFLHNLISKIKSSKTKAVFYALDIDEHAAMMQECGMFVDKVVKA